eukprot:gene349-biopygen250
MCALFSKLTALQIRMRSVLVIARLDAEFLEDDLTNVTVVNSDPRDHSPTSVTTCKSRGWYQLLPRNIDTPGEDIVQVRAALPPPAPPPYNDLVKSTPFTNHYTWDGREEDAQREALSKKDESGLEVAEAERILTLSLARVRSGRAKANAARKDDSVMVYEDSIVPHFFCVRGFLFSRGLIFGMGSSGSRGWTWSNMSISLLARFEVEISSRPAGEWLQRRAEAEADELQRGAAAHNGPATCARRRSARVGHTIQSQLVMSCLAITAEDVGLPARSTSPIAESWLNCFHSGSFPIYPGVSRSISSQSLHRGVTGLSIADRIWYVLLLVRALHGGVTRLRAFPSLRVRIGPGGCCAVGPRKRRRCGADRRQCQPLHGGFRAASRVLHLASVAGLAHGVHTKEAYTGGDPRKKVMPHLQGPSITNTFYCNEERHQVVRGGVLWATECRNIKSRKTDGPLNGFEIVAGACLSPPFFYAPLKVNTS